MTDLSKEQINEFAKKELEMAHVAHLVLHNAKDSMASDVLSFVRAGTSGSAWFYFSEWILFRWLFRTSKHSDLIIDPNLIYIFVIIDLDAA
jgi:hypothetical protein